MSSQQPLKLIFFDQEGDGRAAIAKEWVLKGLLARGETSSWIAPPGAGKSALLTEISIHCAAGTNWRGHKAKQACGVLVLALERADLYRRRLQAYRQRDELATLPIAIAGDVIDLLNPSSIGLIASAVEQTEIHFDCLVGLIVVDTFAKGIAVNGGDEDRARDQNRAAANFRTLHAILRTEQRPGVHIALVGHTGKDESRGARGSNAHAGDVDIMVQISGDKIKVADITKANDQPERSIAQFQMETVTLGTDDDGDPMTTAIVTCTDAGALEARRSKSKLRGKSAAGLQALRECVADGECPKPGDPHVPASARGVTMAVWRDRLEKTRLINRDGNPRQEFSRIHVTLKNIGAIGIWEDFVWPVT